MISEKYKEDVVIHEYICRLPASEKYKWSCDSWLHFLVPFSSQKVWIKWLKMNFMFRFLAPDHRRRMLLSNCLARIADRLEESLHQVHKIIFLSFVVFCCLFACWSLFAFARREYSKGVGSTCLRHCIKWDMIFKVWSLLEAGEDCLFLLVCLLVSYFVYLFIL